MGVGYNEAVLIGNALIGIGMLFAIFQWIFVMWNRKKTIVAMAQPTLLSLLCLGAFITLVGVNLAGRRKFPLGETVYETNWRMWCKAEYWTKFFGVNLMLLVVLAKLCRVYQAVESRDNSTLIARHFMPILLFLIMLMVYANIAVMFIYPPEYTTEIISGEEGNDPQRQGICYPVGSAGAALVMTAKAMVELPLGLVILVFAIKLRDVREEVGETRKIIWSYFINMALYINHWIMIFFPTWFNMDPKTGSVFEHMLFVITYILHTATMTGFLIIPRMYYVWYENKHGRLPGRLNVADREQSNGAITPVRNNSKKAEQELEDYEFGEAEEVESVEAFTDQTSEPSSRSQRMDGGEPV